jgi:hypothetical protein
VERHLYAYEYVDLAYDDIVDLLERVPTAILQPATEAASARAHEVLSTLYIPLGGFELAREVTVEVGNLERAAERRAKLPLEWHATQRHGLFPEMNALLEVAALSVDEPQCQVTLIGTYVPPAGVVGAVGDTVAALHRLAEAAVHRLVRDICVRLEAELSR